MRVVIDDIDMDERHRFRLSEIGLAAGTSLSIAQRGVFGGRVIACGTERIAVDGGTAKAIRVHAVSDEVLASNETKREVA